MKRIYIGLLFVAGFIQVLPSRVKRFSGNDQRTSNEWNWGRGDQMMADAQMKGASQPTWPSKGSGGTTKGRGDSTTNRDGSWGSDSWSSGENRKDGFGMGWNMQPPQGNNKGSAYPDGSDEEGGNLETLLRGVPGMDFPDFVVLPDTAFDCSQMPAQGYYGDVEAGCQVFHICQPGNRKDSFLCPVGTIFNQKYFVCDWWFNVNCSDTPSYYNLNDDLYKNPEPAPTEVPVTTEKTLPWNAQDLDKKRPTTKSWNNQPSLGKQNPNRKDTPNRRGSKTNSVTTTREVSNTWSRSDAQKEVTLSWGSSSGIYGSSSTSSNSVIPTTKPIWYGIDGQPSKDQSNGMARRNGLVQTPPPFGTRMRSSTLRAAANTLVSTEVYPPTSMPASSTTYGSSTTRGWLTGEDVPENSQGNFIYRTPASTKNWLQDDSTKKFAAGNTNDNYEHSTTGGWLRMEDNPETSINPSDIKGVWEQDISRVSANNVSHKGYVRKSVHSGSGRNYNGNENAGGQWKQNYKNAASKTRWPANGFEDSLEKSSIARRKSWK